MWNRSTCNKIFPLELTVYYTPFLLCERVKRKMRENLLSSLPFYKFSPTLTPTQICFISLQTPKLRRAPPPPPPPHSRVHTKAMEVGGLDSKGRQFKNAEEMWREQTGDPSKKCDWYKHGVGYWEGVEASVNGVLGGYAQVNEPDIEGSEAFLNTLLSERFPNSDHFAALGISTLSLSLSVSVWTNGFFFSSNPEKPLVHCTLLWRFLK